MDKSIIIHPDTLTRFGTVGTWTKQGWIPPDDLTFDKWLEIGAILSLVEKSLRLWIGDWLNYGESRWDDKYSQAMDSTGYAYGTLANSAWVTDRVPNSLRRESLSFSHYQTVAPLKTLDERAEWLARAEAEEWSVRQLEKEIRSSNSHAPRTRLIPCTLCGGSGYLEETV
jgi:hypothetical protein